MFAKMQFQVIRDMAAETFSGVGTGMSMGRTVNGVCRSALDMYILDAGE